MTKTMAVEAINKKMKTLRNLVFLGVLSLSISCFMTSCESYDRNADYPFTVRVLTSTPDDTLPVPNVLVEVNVPLPNTNVYFEGFTDEFGRVSFKHDESAVLAVRASRGKRPNFTWMGCTDVRLLPGEEVIKTVYLEPYDSLLIGCAVAF